MPIDKTQLYQMFDKSLRRSERLSDMATRKALDLPLDDDMQIITNNTRQGLGLLGALLLGAATLAGGSGAAIGLIALLNESKQGAADSGAVQPQEFKVTFWTEDDQPLEVDSDE